MTTRWTVTMDCAHPGRLAAFWRLALGYAEASPPEGFGSLAEWFTHVERLTAAGATVVREDVQDGTPEGNEFCVL
jgi:hypothetical protein